jgi:5-methylcytosine-specific restriction protein A
VDRARPAPAAPAPVGSGSARIIRDSAGWFALGAARKRTAGAMKRCAECFALLPARRRLYCSSACQWRFHGRYFWDAARVVVLRRDHYTCRACGVRRRKRELEVDHIVEIARGGGSLDYGNLQTLCKSCHRRKTAGFLRGRARGARPVRSGVHASPAAPEPEWFPA